jgi:uncharacterized phiE125 gp8 family phage protein
MIERGGLPTMADAIDEAKDYMRIDTTADDAAIAGLIVTAVVRCEGFVGRTLIERTMRETIVPVAAWTGLGTDPVKAVTGVGALAIDGVETAVPVASYEIDLNADGRARVRFVTIPGTRRAIVTYRAGAASGWRAVPAGLRQGIIRLVSHEYLYRERAEAPAMPAAVTALWQPERRMRLS